MRRLWWFSSLIALVVSLLPANSAARSLSSPPPRISVTWLSSTGREISAEFPLAAQAVIDSQRYGVRVWVRLPSEYRILEFKSSSLEEMGTPAPLGALRAWPDTDGHHEILGFISRSRHSEATIRLTHPKEGTRDYRIIAELAGPPTRTYVSPVCDSAGIALRQTNHTQSPVPFVAVICARTTDFETEVLIQVPRDLELSFPLTQQRLPGLNAFPLQLTTIHSLPYRKEPLSVFFVHSKESPFPARFELWWTGTRRAETQVNEPEPQEPILQIQRGAESSAIRTANRNRLTVQGAYVSMNYEQTDFTAQKGAAFGARLLGIWNPFDHWEIGTDTLVTFESMSLLSATALAGYSPPLLPNGWRASLLLGAGYLRFATSSGESGFSTTLMPQYRATLTRDFPNGHTALAYAALTPARQELTLFDTSEAQLSAGMSWRIPKAGFSLLVDYSQLLIKPSDVDSVRLRSITVGMGIGI